ncbi:MAG: hypothetical protein ACRBN8_10720 [Nannocystales bacterium]
MSEGPLSAPRYGSARERALAETAIEWPRYECEVSDAALETEPVAWRARQSESRVPSHVFVDPLYPCSTPVRQEAAPVSPEYGYVQFSPIYGVVAGVLVAGVGVGFVVLSALALMLPTSGPEGTLIFLGFAAGCAVYVADILRRWRRG